MSSSNCLPEDTLRKLAAPSAEIPNVEDARRHLAQCIVCQQRLNELTSVHEGGITPVELREAETTRRLDDATPLVDDDNDFVVNVAPVLKDRFARFSIVKELGTGGFGIVYQVFDPNLERDVALKIPRASAMVDPRWRQRFLREARAMAVLHHPGIVPVHEIGEADGLVYITTAFCPGTTLAKELIRLNRQMPIETVVRIVALVAEAVGHAHSRRVIHLDLKPENILLDSTQRAEGLAYTPRLTDFGLAELIDEQRKDSQSVAAIGTILYMSPEQAEGIKSLIGRRSDVYSLGVILYEMLTGKMPHAADGQASTLVEILKTDPIPPSRLNPLVPRDLEAICLRCLEKNQFHRYETADELAADLRRYLAGAPTVARPLSLAQRLGRWTLRRPALAFLLATVTAAVLVILGGTLQYLRDVRLLNQQLENALTLSRESSRQARVSEELARDFLYASEIRLASEAWRAGDDTDAAARVKRLESLEFRPPTLGFELSFLKQIAAPPSDVIVDVRSPLYTLDFSSNEDVMALGGFDGVIRVRETATWKPVCSFPTRQVETNCVRFSPDGKWLATSGDDGTVKLWDWKKCRERWSIKAHDKKAFGLAFTPDGKLLLSGGTDFRVRAWSVETGEPVREYLGAERESEAVAISPDGRWVGTATDDGNVHVWNLESGERVQTLPHGGPASSLVFTDDSRGVIVGSSHTDSVTIWDFIAGKLLQRHPSVETIHSVDYQPAGRLMASINGAGGIHVDSLDIVDNHRSFLGQEGGWQAHRTKGYCVRILRKQGALVSVSGDGTCRLWNWKPLVKQVAHVPGPSMSLRGMFLPNGSLAIVNQFRSLEVRPANDLEVAEAVELSGHSPREIWPLGRSDQLLVGCRAGAKTCVLLLAGPGRSPRVIYTDPRGWPVDPIGCSDDGTLVYAAAGTGDDFELLAIETATGEVRHREAGWHILQTAIHGERVITTYMHELRAGTVGRPGFTVLGLPQENHIQRLTLSSDGTLLALGVARQARIFDAITGKWTIDLGNHNSHITGLVFVDNDRRLVTSGDDGTVALWNVASGQRLLDLYRGEENVSNLSLSPDRGTLAISLATAEGASRVVLVQLAPNAD
jgi:serine/threonine protein kinase/WD40 repeat protein